MSGVVRIGTSGWHYKHWLGVFYPAKLAPKEMFDFYSLHFDTVELNNTFYRLPQPETFESWSDNSPDNFLFAVKASRFITHMKKLKDPESSTVKFFDGAERLGRKLGPILFQLPPRWTVNIERLAKFLEVLPEEHRYVIEIRDESWFVKEVYDVLREFNVALCIHDLANMNTPVKVLADFTYIRFHGPGAAKYCGSYSDSAIREWAERISEWRGSNIDAYVYFNNDIGGHAITNAQKLKQLLAV
jgi:uncharacterized protein YecE (DUF72 family)